MQIRLATRADLDAVMRLLNIGRQRMVAAGNTQQWVEGYPRRATVEEDLRRAQCYVGENDGRVVATFVLAEGPDPTYARIWQGQWLDNERAYHVIHRMAAEETQRGRVCRSGEVLQVQGQELAYRHPSRQCPDAVQHQKTRL